MAKKKERGEFRIEKCAGCGRYEKQVDSRVINWYCSDCSFGNGNYFRNKAGRKMITPAKNVRKGSVVTSVFGKKYKVLDVGYVFKNTTYYFVVEHNSKNDVPCFLGDYQIVK